MKKRKVLSILLLLLLVLSAVLFCGCKSILQGLFGIETGEKIVLERVDLQDEKEHKRLTLNKTKKTATLLQYNYLNDSEEQVICEVPSHVEYDGETYTVTAVDSEMGIMWISDTFSNKYIKELIIPSTVSMIRLFYFGGNLKFLERITVSSDNEHFKSIDGVLYDKNIVEMKYYPRAKSDANFVIPRTLRFFDNEIYYNKHLQSISVEAGNTVFSSIDGVLYSYDGTKLLCYPAGKQGEHFVVPNSVKSISTKAFAFVKYGSVNKLNELQTLYIPKNVTFIDGGSIFSMDVYCEVEALPEGYLLSVDELTLHLNTSLEEYQSIISAWEDNN